jgi:hypothetical protein
MWLRDQPDAKRCCRGENIVLIKLFLCRYQPFRIIAIGKRNLFRVDMIQHVRIAPGQRHRRQSFR